MAVDIGGTHVSSALVDAGLQVRGERRVPLDADAPARDLLDAVANGVEQRHLHAAADAPVAIAIPGPFDYARGIGDFHGVDKFRALRGVDVRAGLARRWHRRTASIRFVNDAEAFGLGEWAVGAGERADRCVAITLGTGIGTAFVATGRCVTTGADVPLQGNLHTVTVDGTPLEERVSRSALMAEFARRTGHAVDVEEIAGLARSGDDVARHVLEDGMRALGRALAPWLISFGTGRLVVGGSMVASADVLFPSLREQLGQEMRCPPRVVPGELPAERASLIGARVAITR